MVRHNQPTNYLIHEKVSLQKRFWAKMLLAFLSVLDSLTSVLDGIGICSCRIKNNLLGLLFSRELFHPRMFSIFFNILLCFHFLNSHFLFLLTWHFFFLFLIFALFLLKMTGTENLNHWFVKTWKETVTKFKKRVNYISCLGKLFIKL